MELIYDNLLGTYGPFAVFLLLMLTGIGIPLGEDLIIIPAGILLGFGELHPLWLTAICAYLGVILSDCMWFGLCWWYGTRLLHKRWFKRAVHPRRLLEVKHQIERRGMWVIVMARFIPGSRTPAITAAGVLHLSFLKFGLATATACLVTVPLQLALGYFIAKGIGSQKGADHIQWVIAVMVGILAVLMGLNWWRQIRTHRRRPPRAKAAWLRRFRPVRRRASVSD
jgi:membrane protein DedA with SNARE-associated domain